MSNDVPRFEKIINRINIVYGLQFPVGVSTLLVIITWIFRPEYFQPNSLPLYATMISLVTIVSIIHSLMSESLSRRQTMYIYACYHGALAVFTLAVAPFLSPFEFLWIVLAIGMDLIFGKRAMYATLAVYAMVLAGAFYQTNQVIAFELVIRILAQYLGVTFIALQVSNYRRVSDDERVALDTTSQASAFERQRLLSLINNMGEAVVATDEKGKILLYNAAVLNLFDTNQTLDGKKLDTILNLKNKAGRAVKLFELAARSSSGLTTTDYTHQYKPGDAINLYINMASIKLGFRQDSEKGYIVLLRDITKEKSLEEERDEFISVISHELRTPVAIAEGNISNALYVNDKKTNKKLVHESLTQAHDQVVFLAGMINDLATLSRAERADVEVELTELDPAALVHALADDYKPQAELKNLTFAASVAKETKRLVTCELYLHEILQNFITNAIKYTATGSVLLHVRSNSKGEAVFSVSDTGIGLSKADQKRVFDKFFRSEDYRTRESSGTGLGLYVTAKLAHRINASIELQSELNKGSTFTITVPPMIKKHH